MTDRERIQEFALLLKSTGGTDFLRLGAETKLTELSHRKVRLTVALLRARNGERPQQRIAFMDKGGKPMMLAFPDPKEALTKLFPDGSVELLQITVTTLLDWLIHSPAYGILLPVGPLDDPEHVDMVVIDKEMAKTALGVK